jgi:zinc transport system substrate-binding protein
MFSPKRGMQGVILFLVLLTLLACTGCIRPAEEEISPAVSVAVTIPPQAEMVREIGDGRVDVVILVPPGSDPHTYEPSLSLIQKAAGADIYLKLGNGLFPVEDMLATRLREMNPDLIVVDTSAGIEYLGPEGKRDPHVWLSLKNAVVMVGNTRDALVLADPPFREVYQENSGRYIARINEIDQKIAAEFSENDPGLILTTHQAWDYFARDYNLSIVSIEHDGKEPTAQDLRDLISQGRRQGVSHVFAEAQENRREAQVVADEIGATVIIIDPLSPDYLASMEQVAMAFTRS